MFTLHLNGPSEGDPLEWFSIYTTQSHNTTLVKNNKTLISHDRTLVSHDTTLVSHVILEPISYGRIVQ